MAFLSILLVFSRDLPFFTALCCHGAQREFNSLRECLAVRTSFPWCVFYGLTGAFPSA